MGWSIGWDSNWDRDIGYGVPAVCDHPGCNTQIDRGLGYVCGGHPYGGDQGCGLFFCGTHLYYVRRKNGRLSEQLCDRCSDGKPAFEAKKDTRRWLRWKLTDESWAKWRAANPEEVAELRKQFDISSDG